MKGAILGLAFSAVAFLSSVALLPAFADDSAVAENTPTSADVIVYGGTSGAVIAAVQARKDGKSVILISPDKHLGGVTSSGLGKTDLGNPSAIGGLSKEFYHRIWLHYQNPSAWNGGAVPKKLPGPGQVAGGGTNPYLYVFEPKVAEAVFDQLIAENKIPVVHARLDLNSGVLKEGTRITGIRVEDGRVFHGRMFIDATYEGDLMAKAGVSYAVGREPSSQYGEKLNGLQVRQSRNNQLPPGIDPYVRKGDPSSGLLPDVNPPTTEPDGTGDKRIQAYGYRMCLTSDPANRVTVAKPDGYREADYELLFRTIEAGQTSGFFKLDLMPNHKTDSNNSGGLSTDDMGINDAYPDGDYATREKIARTQELWQRGLLWTLQSSPRVPPAIRAAYAKWGLPRDEFTDNDNWPPALYVREARRLVGDYVLTEPILEKDAPAARPIGMGSYTMDSHNVQRLVGADGMVHNEGNVQKGVRPYQIDYGVLLPKRAECENLLVPFCISASHIAFGSVRMEPVFMVLGQSAASAADLALDNHVAVQDVPYDRLKEKLTAGGQVLDLK